MATPRSALDAGADERMGGAGWDEDEAAAAAAAAANWCMATIKR